MTCVMAYPLCVADVHRQLVVGEAANSVASTYRYALQRTAAHCSALQHSATHCSTLQHTATHSNVYRSALSGQSWLFRILSSEHLCWQPRYSQSSSKVISYNTLVILKYLEWRANSWEFLYVQRASILAAVALAEFLESLLYTHFIQ